MEMELLEKGTCMKAEVDFSERSFESLQPPFTIRNGAEGQQNFRAGVDRDILTFERHIFLATCDGIVEMKGELCIVT